MPSPRSHPPRGKGSPKPSRNPPAPCPPAKPPRRCTKRLKKEHRNGTPIVIKRPKHDFAAGDVSPFWSPSASAASESVWGASTSASSPCSAAAARLTAPTWFRSSRWRLPDRPTAAAAGVPQPISLQERIATGLRVKAAAVEQAERVKELRNEKARQTRWAKAGLTPEQMAERETKRLAKKARREDKEGTKARKTRIRPTAQQKRQLQTAFDACRWVYNRCAEHVNKKGRKRKDLVNELRAGYVNEGAWNTICAAVSPKWSDIPYEVRDGALRDAAKAVASTDANMQAQAADANQEKTKKWEFDFRRKKDITESLQLRKRDLNNPNATTNWFRKLFGTPEDRSVMALNRRKKGSKKNGAPRTLPANFDTDVRLLHDKRLGRYYLIVAILPEREGDNQALAPNAAAEMDVVAKKAPRVVSIDPGVRTFMTCFDPQTGAAAKWGERANCTLWRQANRLHAINKRMSKLDPNTKRKHKHLRGLRRVARRREQKIRNLVDELHHKSALWLASNYDYILLPKFDVKQMAKKRDATTKKWKRKISKKTVSQLYTLAHYRFRQFLQHKSQEHGSTVFMVTEHYTTKTCSHCGRMHYVGSSEVFDCPFCRVSIDRDVNASVNILLKFVHDNQLEEAALTQPTPEGLGLVCY